MEKKNETLIDLGYEVSDVYKNSMCLRKKFEDDTIVYCDIHFEDKTIVFSQSLIDGRPVSPYPASIEEVEAAMDVLYSKSFTVNFI